MDMPGGEGTDGWLNLVASLERAFEEPTTWIVCALLIFIALLAWIRMRAVRKVTRKVDDAIARSEPQGTIAALRGALNGLGLKQLATAVFQFERSLVALPDGRHRRTVGADHHVRLEVLALEARPSSGPAISIDSLEHVAGWCTGLGILGTFVGVCMGLGHIAGAQDAAGAAPRVTTVVETGPLDVVKPGGGETSTPPPPPLPAVSPLDKAIMPVVADLATAFWTSIFGVIFAMVTGYFARRSYDRIEAAAAAVCARLEELTTDADPGQNALSDVTAQVLRDVSNSDVVKRFIGQVKDNTLDQMLQTGVERLLANPTLARVMRGAQDALNQRFDAVAQAISDRMVETQQIAEDHVKAFTKQAVFHIGAAVKDAMAEMGNEFRGLRDGARELATQLATSSDESSALQQAMRESAALSRDNLTVIGDVVRQQEGLVIALRDNLRQTTSELADFSQRLNRSIRETLDETLTTTTSIKKQLGDLANGSDSLAQALNALPEVVAAIGNFQQGVFDQLGQNQAKVAETFGKLEEGLRQSQTQQAVKLAETFTALQRQINSGLESVVKQTLQSRDGMTQAVQQLGTLQAGLAESVERLRETGANLRTAALDAKQATTSQTATQAEIQRTLERVAQLASELRALPSVNQAMSGHLDRLSGEFATMRTSLDAISSSGLTDALDDLREALTGTAPGLLGNLRGLSERLVEVRDALQTAQPPRLPTARVLEPPALRAGDSRLSVTGSGDASGPAES